jgi:hypothetical protein
MNLKLIGYHDHLNDEGEFVAWTVLFTDVDRGRRMVAMVDGGALFEPAMFPNCKAFDVGHLAQDHLAPVEFPSEVIIGLVKTAIRHEVEPAKDE